MWSIVSRVYRPRFSIGASRRTGAALADAVARFLDRAGATIPVSIPGAVFLVRLGTGQEILRCFGDAGDGSPVGEDTLFQAMSISKPLAAFGALRLAHLGLLDPDVPVVDLLKTWAFPPDHMGGFDARGITVRRILCHAAGLNIHGYDWAEPGRPRPPAAELLDGRGDPNNQLRLVSPPGAAALYSGGGYTLLQQVIEDVTGRSYGAVMRDTVLVPLGMTRSTFDDDDPILARLAVGHDAYGRPLPRARIAATACSGLYTSARDLTRFMTALSPGLRGEPAGRGLIPPRAAEQMTTAQALDANGHGWSLGFYMLKYRDGSVFHHAGYKSGWWSQVDSVVGRGHTIATMTNSDASEVHIKPIIAELRRLLLRS